jgi:hypothetical protein
MNRIRPYRQLRRDPDGAEARPVGVPPPATDGGRMRPDRILFAWLASGIRPDDYTISDGAFEARIDDDRQRRRAAVIAEQMHAGRVTVTGRLVTVELGR